MKLPYIDLYIGDWLKDPVSGCSVAAQGLWLRLMFVMQESPNRGYLCQPDNFATPLLDVCLARRCGCDTKEYASLMAELFEAGVPSKTETGVIYSRRMVRDEALRLIRTAAGSKGGRARLLKQKAKQTPSKDSSKLQANADGDDDADADSSSSQGSVRGVSRKELADAIYDLYPRKVGKPAAVKAILTQLNSHPFELLRDATAKLSGLWAGQDMTYLPHPSTWFNQQRFNDSPETWAPKAATSNGKPIIKPDHSNGF